MSQPDNHAHAIMAERIRAVASALADLNATWDELGLPGDWSTPETGYPFAMSLDEQAAEVWAWADIVASTEDK